MKRLTFITMFAFAAIALGAVPASALGRPGWDCHIYPNASDCRHTTTTTVPPTTVATTVPSTVPVTTSSTTTATTAVPATSTTVVAETTTTTFVGGVGTPTETGTPCIPPNGEQHACDTGNGSLPFTGSGTALVASVGLMFVAVGTVMVRRRRDR